MATIVCQYLQLTEYTLQEVWRKVNNSQILTKRVCQKQQTEFSSGKRKRSPSEQACALLGSQLTHVVRTPGAVKTPVKPSAHTKSAHVNGGTEKTNSKAVTECPVHRCTQNPSAWAAPPEVVVGGEGSSAQIGNKKHQQNLPHEEKTES